MDQIGLCVCRPFGIDQPTKHIHTQIHIRPSVILYTQSIRHAFAFCGVVPSYCTQNRLYIRDCVCSVSVSLSIRTHSLSLSLSLSQCGVCVCCICEHRSDAMGFDWVRSWSARAEIDRCVAHTSGTFVQRANDAHVRRDRG